MCARSGCRSSLLARADLAGTELPVRVIYLTREIGLAHVTTDFEIREQGSGAVSGRFWSTSGPENRSALERTYGCRTVLDVPYSAWVCRVAATQVNWRRVLAKLDRIGVMAPPLAGSSRERLQRRCALDSCLYAAPR